MQFLYRAPIGLVEADAQGAITLANPMAAQLLLPLSADGGLDNLVDLLKPLLPQLPALIAAQQADAGPVCDGLRMALPTRPNQRDSDPEVLGLSLQKLDAGHLMAVVFDATQEVRRERQHLARAARTDALTRMPNRAAAREHVAAALARRQADPRYQFAVLFINCDRFRHINDSAGYASGDRVLAQMADRLRTGLRGHPRPDPVQASDPAQLAARVGGDEFVVVLESLTRAEDARTAALRLMESLAQPYESEGRLLYCGVSMGIVLHADMAADADRVLYDAGLAMAEAKRSGGRRSAVFDASMSARALQRSTLENDLRGALDLQQLFVVYQPVVTLRTDTVDAAEALVRWRHPLHGLVSPATFIPIAESCGLIDALGAFVLRTACRQFMAWKTQFGASAPQLMAVNLSRAQLAQPGLVDEVRAVLVECGMPAQALQLEVTESLAAQDETVQMRLQELKLLGLTLALDDFGTGYSSLAALHQLPIDLVKIDRSFVSQLGDSLHHRVLTDATVRVAQSLGLHTVAEGIETPEQAVLLKDMGCDKGQGYWYSPPLTRAEFDTWLGARLGG